MDYRHFIASVLCFFLAGCSTPIIYSDSELQAQDHMRRAAALENSQKYQKAAKEYAIVAERYPSTRYFQPAVLKAALLNIHPDNPETDPDTALRWFKIYLTLPLSRVEKQSVELHIAMVERISHLEADISRLNTDNKKFQTMTRKQSQELAAGTQQLKELKAELGQVRAQLEEMKEVDLQMHTRRVNGGEGKPAELAEKVQELHPEAYSPDTTAATYPEKGEIEDSSTAHKKMVFHTDNRGSTPHPGIDDTSPNRQGTYPYTVQVSSFSRKEHAIRAASALRNNGNHGFTSHALIPGRGDWYRVFIGFYRTRDEAEKNALALKKHEYPSAFAVKMPFAIQIETPDSDEAQKKMEEDLQSKGFLVYRIQNGKSDDNSALLVGAFETKEETLGYSKSLQEAGFKSSVVQR